MPDSNGIYERDGIMLVMGERPSGGVDPRYGKLERDLTTVTPARAATFDETLDRGIDRVNRSSKGIGSVIGNFFGSIFGAGSVEATGEKLPSVKHVVDRTFDSFNNAANQAGKVFSPLVIAAFALGGLWLLKD